MHCTDELWQRLKHHTAQYPSIRGMIDMVERGEMPRETVALTVAVTLLDKLAEEKPVKP